MLILMSGLYIGPYFCYDFPGSLELEIEQSFGVKQIEYQTLYSMASIPNIVLPFFAGIVFDKIGSHNGLVLCSFVLTAGQGLCVIGGYRLNFTILQCGRVLFGIGNESLNVAALTMIV